MDLDALKEAVEQVRFGIEHHGGVFNEDLKVLDGVDPQAWSLIEDYIDRVLAAARAVLDSEQIWWCNADRAEWPEDDEFGEYCAHDRERGCGFVFVVRVRLLAEEGT